MKKLTTLIFAIIYQSLQVSGQDMFPARQLTFDPAQQGFATWSPDDSMIAFTSTRTGNFDIWIMDVNANKIRKESEAFNNK